MTANRSIVGLASALAVVSSAPAFAQSKESVEDFYKHTSLTLVVGSDATGEYDQIGRLLMRHLGQHIPGNPTVIVQNRGGASGITAANYLYSAAPRDGSMIGTLNKSIPFYQATGVANTNYKADAFNWIGTFTRSNNLVTVMARTGIKTIQDARTKSATMGSIGAGGTMSTYPILLNNTLGTKFKLVQGYAGAQLVDLAMQRGEVDGRGSYTWSDLKAKRMDWLQDHKINILVQFGFERETDLPDVPTLIDLARDDREKAVFKFISSDIPVGRPFLAPPGVPKERVEALRRAFDATMKDPDFIKDAETIGSDVKPETGEDLQSVVDQIVSTPPDIVRTAGDLMQEK